MPGRYYSALEEVKAMINLGWFMRYLINIFYSKFIFNKILAGKKKKKKNQLLQVA